MKQPIRLTPRGENLKEAAGAVLALVILPLSFVALVVMFR